MGLFNKKKQKNKEAAEQIAQAAPAEVAGEGSGAAEGLADSELIAVIAAAISAYESEQFIQTLYIRKLDRRAGIRPVWGATGTNEAIDMRRM